jgi:aquaporin Z
MLRKLVVEAIGTFLFLVVIGQVVIGGAGAFAPLAIGCTLMVLVYAGGHLSGGHYNPAVTLAVWLRGGARTAEVLPYWAAQIGGALAASVVVSFLNPGSPVTAIDVAVAPVLLAEFLFTFALCYVVLNVATVRSTDGNSYYGLAIGFTVVVGAYAVGGVSGGAFNPAVVAGLTAVGLISMGSVWIYFVAQLAAGAAAAAVFRALDMGSERTVVPATPLREPMPAGEVAKD